MNDDTRLDLSDYPEPKEHKRPVIVVAPDNTCLDDDGRIKLGTDVIFISDSDMYDRMQAVLAAWGNESMGVPGQRGDIKG